MSGASLGSRVVRGGRSGVVVATILVLGLGAASAQVRADDDTETAAVRVNRYILAQKIDRAVEVCREGLSDDRSDPALRGACAQAATMRNRVCFPVPPDAAALRECATGIRLCDASLLAPAVEDSIVDLLAVESRLVPEDIQSHLLLVDHESRFGTPERLRQALGGLRRFEAAVVHEQLLIRLQAIRRPGMAAEVARGAFESAPDTLGCDAAIKIAGTLLQAGAYPLASAVLHRAPADSFCIQQTASLEASILVVAGRHRELWDLTNKAPAGIKTFEYYRYVLLATLAAAHFDSSLARKRLDHEEANKSAYPEMAQTFLDDLRALLDEPAAPGEAWAELAQRDFLAGIQFADVRHLIRSLALRRNPRLGPAAVDQAKELDDRNQLAAAAKVLEEVGGGRRPDLDHRWDPRRPEYLRRSADYYFKADDDASCRAVLDAIDESNATDWLLAGAAAFRAGDWSAARSDLERVKAPVAAAEHIDAATRLLALIPDPEGRDASP